MILIELSENIVMREFHDSLEISVREMELTRHL